MGWCKLVLSLFTCVVAVVGAYMGCSCLYCICVCMAFVLSLCKHRVAMSAAAKRERGNSLGDHSWPAGACCILPASHYAPHSVGYSAGGPTQVHCTD